MNETATDWYDPNVATFGDRLAAARLAMGLDQQALAGRLGVKLITVQKWEDDLAEPRANRLSMMAGLLGVSMTWLINGQGDGVDAPDEAIETAADMQELMAELRELRTGLLAKAEQAARIEKRLRLLSLEAERDGNS